MFLQNLQQQQATLPPRIGGINPIGKHRSYHCSRGQSDNEYVIKVETVSAIKEISAVLCSPHCCASMSQS